MAATADRPAQAGERDPVRALVTAAVAAPLAWGVLTLAGHAMGLRPDALGAQLLGLLPLALVSVQLLVTANQLRGQRRRRRERLQRQRRRAAEVRGTLARAERRETQLAQARQLRAAFLGCLTHEVRTPMDGILGMTELALATDLTDEQEQLLGAARDSTHALLAVVDRVLDHERLAAGTSQLATEPLDLEQVVSRAIQELAARGPAACRQPACHLAPGLATRRIGDGPRLAQVLVALGLAAAQRARGSSLVLSIEPGADPDELLLSVTDGGLRPEPGATARPLHPFADSEDLPGLAMELGVACAVARLMGGDLLERGEQPGPRELLARLPCPAADPVTSDVRRPRPRAVVVADEDLGRRQTLVRSLTGLGARVQEADTVRQALELVDQASEEDLLLVEDDLAGRERLEARCAPAAAGPRLLRLLAPGSAPTDGALVRPLLPSQLERLLSDGPAPSAVAGTPAGGTVNPAPASQSGQASPHAAAGSVDESPAEAAAEDRGPAAASRAAPTPPAAASPAVEEGAHTRPGSGRRPLRLLLAEDTAVSREVARRMLTAWGHTVWLARDGREALEIHAEQDIDAVLMDVSMPVLDGLDATAALRAREQGSTRHVPIVAMTAHAGPDDRRRCLAAGMDDFITKPVRAAELRAVLERLPVQPSPRSSTWSTSKSS